MTPDETKRPEPFVSADPTKGSGFTLGHLTRPEFEELLIVLGMATQVSLSNPEHARMFGMALRSVNAINRGNPNFIPYEVDPLPDKALSDIVSDAEERP